MVSKERCATRISCAALAVAFCRSIELAKARASRREADRNLAGAAAQLEEKGVTRPVTTWTQDVVTGTGTESRGHGEAANARDSRLLELGLVIANAVLERIDDPRTSRSFAE
jgi:hypothetical protein